MKRYIIFGLSLLMLSVAPVAAQDGDSEQLVAKREKNVKPRKQYPTRDVKGRVLNAATKAPVSGAMVRTAEVEGYSALNIRNQSSSLCNVS